MVTTIAAPEKTELLQVAPGYKGFHSTFNTKVGPDLKRLAQLYHGDRGTFAYEAFDYINRAYFDDDLPVPFIQWAITPHGKCIGITNVTDRPPVITLHPSILGGSKGKAEPWSIPADLLGPAYAFDVLVHECIHVSVCYLIGSESGPSPHNCPEWVSECNRIAPHLGLPNFTAAESKVGRPRVPHPDPAKAAAGKTIGGSPMRFTRESRLGGLAVSFDEVSRFPHPIRLLAGQQNYYRRNALPFRHALERPHCNSELEVTDADESG